MCRLGVALLPWPGAPLKFKSQYWCFSVRCGDHPGSSQEFGKLFEQQKVKPADS